jgi:hypothetical protein
MIATSIKLIIKRTLNHLKILESCTEKKKKYRGIDNKKGMELYIQLLVLFIKLSIAVIDVVTKKIK